MVLCTSNILVKIVSGKPKLYKIEKNLFNTIIIMIETANPRDIKLYEKVQSFPSCRDVPELNKFILSELIDHNKRNLDKILPELIIFNIDDYKIYKTMDDVISKIYKKYIDLRGFGNCSIYDMAAGICKYLGIPINKIYLYGKGPKDAISSLKLLKLQQKDINGLTCIEIKIVKNRLYEKNYPIPENIKNSIDGDEWESWLCGEKNKISKW